MKLLTGVVLIVGIRFIHLLEKYMRRFTICAVAAMIALMTSVIAQTRVTTVEDHAREMKLVSQANGALNKSIAAAAYADVGDGIVTLRQSFKALEAFWVEKKRDDADRIVKDGLRRLDALEQLISAPAVDQIAVQAAASEFRVNTCNACHKLYREGDNQTGYRFRAGVF